LGVLARTGCQGAGAEGRCAGVVAGWGRCGRLADQSPSRGRLSCSPWAAPSGRAAS